MSSSGRRISRWLLPAAGYSISVACLIWVYRGFDWSEELPRFWATDPRWLILALAGDIAVYCCQGWRWSVLLRPVARLPVWRAIQAVYIGLFANEILPLRTGEVIRCYLASRWGRMPFSVAISSAVVERLFDGIWLILGIVLAASFVALPGFLVVGSQILGAVLAAVAVLVALAVFHREKTAEAVRESRWASALHHLVHGLHDMGRSPTFAVAAALSLAYLALQVVPIYVLMRGVDLDLSVAQAGLVLVILRLGSVPPQAPGNVGSFQALTVAALLLCGVERTTATRFATLLFLVVTVPLWLAGFVALIATGMKFGDLRRQAYEGQVSSAASGVNAAGSRTSPGQ
jgi:uncharacterized protein (TIRG00374 family)